MNKLKHHFLGGLVFLGTVTFGYIGYSAYTSLSTQTDGAIITKDIWNNVINTINDIGNRTDGIYSSGTSIGIGTSNIDSGRYKLSVNGNIKLDWEGNPYTHIQIGHDKNDMLIADNSIAQSYGGGYFFRVHDETVPTSNYRDAMMLTKNGYIGIGTTTPSTALHVKNSNDNILTLQTSDDSWLYTQWLKSDGTRKLRMGLDNTLSSFNIGLENGTNSFNVLGGNVGIGTASPVAKLQIARGDSSYAIFGPNATWGAKLRVGMYTPNLDSDTAQISVSNGNIHIDARPGAYATYINHFSQNNTFINPQGGNVGIGTTNPLAKLDVNGNFIRKVDRWVGDIDDGTDDGILRGRSFSFTKNRSDTTLKIEWNDSFRVIQNGNGYVCQWCVQIDGADVACSAEHQYNNSGYSDYHGAKTKTWYVGGIRAGNHTLRTRVTQWGSWTAVDCYTGWRTQESISSEEVY